MAASASLNLVFGFDLSDTANPRGYLHDTSTITATAKVVKQSLSFPAAVGALGIQITNGVATLGTGSNQCIARRGAQAFTYSIKETH